MAAPADLENPLPPAPDGPPGAGGSGAVVHLISTFGLAVFLVLFYVLKLAPKIQEEREALSRSLQDLSRSNVAVSTKIDALGTRIDALEREWDQLLVQTNGNRWLQTQEQMDRLAEFGLEHNEEHLNLAVLDVVDTVRQMDANQVTTDVVRAKVRKAVRDVIDGTRKFWSSFAVPLKKSDFNLATFFKDETERLVEDGINEIVGAMMDRQLTWDQRRGRVKEIIGERMQQARLAYRDRKTSVPAPVIGNKGAGAGY